MGKIDRSEGRATKTEYWRICVTVKVLKDIRSILADLNKYVAVIIGKQLPSISASRKLWLKAEVSQFKSGKRHNC